MQKYFKISSFYLLFGLVMGIFSREFTKLNNFSGYTVLKSVHTHTLVLGFLFFIIVLLLEKNFTISNNKSFNKWIVLYNLGLLYLIITLSIKKVDSTENSVEAIFMMDSFFLIAQSVSTRLPAFVRPE